MISASAGTYNPWPLLFIWFFITVASVLLRKKRLGFTVGLTLAFTINMWVNHGAVAAFFSLPAYPSDGVSTSLTGLNLATLALISFSVGSLLLSPALLKRWQPPHEGPALPVPKPELEKLYLTIGLVSYLILLPIAGKIPTATAIIASGWRFLVVGAVMALWSALGNRWTGRFFVRLLLAIVGLPAMTLLASGFLSYGQAAAIAVLAFSIYYMKPRWPFLLLMPLMAYVGLSFFVTYMRDRSQMRELMWEEEQELGARVDQLSGTLKTFEWFDPQNESHLFLIDGRLNQNFLVGAGIEFLSGGYAKFALGQTVGNAVIALIPRVFWPGKPGTGGSGSLVSDYTGIEFAEGTSVGVGPVLEWYINWGTGGVLVGFLLLGTAIGIADVTAGRYLQEGDWRGFCTWYLPGLALIDVAGSLAEVIPSTAAGFLTSWLVHKYLVPRIFRASFPVSPATNTRS